MGCGILILSYISKFGPFWRFKILNYIGGAGGGAGCQKNKYVQRYDEFIFFYVWGGGHFYQFLGF